MRAVLCLSLFALWCCASGSRAADGEDRYRVFNTDGVATCAGLNEAALRADRDNDWGGLYGYSLYTMGYLTGINRMADATWDIAGGNSSKNLLRWLRRYCSDHPGDSFDRALHQLTRDLYPARLESAP